MFGENNLLVGALQRGISTGILDVLGSQRGFFIENQSRLSTVKVIAVL